MSRRARHSGLWGIPVSVIINTVTATLGVGDYYLWDRSLTRCRGEHGAKSDHDLLSGTNTAVLAGRSFQAGCFRLHHHSWLTKSYVSFLSLCAVRKPCRANVPPGLREQISPTILAVATILVGDPRVCLLDRVEMLRRARTPAWHVNPG